MEKDITIHEVVDKTLQANYRRSAGAMLLRVKYLSTNPASDMVRSLNSLDDEVDRLIEAEEPITKDNKEYKKAMAAYLALLVTTAGLISKTAPAIQSSGQSVAPQSVTARVFIDLTDELIKSGINPMSSQALKIYQNAVKNTGFTIPTPRYLSTQKALDYLDTGAWKEKMMRWGSGYYEKTYNIFENGMANGWSPKYTAARLREVASNIPYSAAESLTRTLQLNAYRQASLEMEKINGSLITGKRWIATIDDKTCIACLAMHGQEIPLDETVSGHYNCFPAGTLITTIDGSKKIETVNVGDYVLSHSGKHNRVSNTMKRDYEGNLIRLTTNSGEVITSTDEHPILVRRQNKNQWLFAKDVKLGDIVFIASQNNSNNIYHFLRNLSVKWSIRNANNSDSFFGKVDILPNVSLRSFIVPVSPVNLNSRVFMPQEKINRVYAYFLFLLKRFSEFFKTKTEVFFWLSLAAVCVVAGGGAIFSSVTKSSYSIFSNQELFSAFSTSNFDAFIFSHVPAFTATIIVLAYLYSAFFKKKLSSTDGAFNGIAITVSYAFETLKRTIFCNSSTQLFGGVGIKDSPANGAHSFVSLWSKFWRSAFVVTRERTIFTRIATGFLNIFRTTHLTNAYFSHSSIVSLGIIPCKLNVYNLEVEKDNTYVASSIVVHNCRCSEFFIVPGGDEYPSSMQVDSLPGQRKFQPFMSGEDWFAAQSPERQARQAAFLNSPAKFRAYQDGLSLQSFIGTHSDPVFGSQTIELSLLKILGKDEAEKYYSVNQ